MKKLLVVDDDVVNCAAISSYFGGRFNIEVRYNGFDFDDTVRKFQPDMILLDINLPGPNGIKLLSAIKPLLSSIPVFMVTVRAGEEDILKAFELGAADYLVKPFSLSVLRARIDRWLDRKESGEVTNLGKAQLRLASGEVAINGKPVSLTQKEQMVLRCFMANSGQILSRQQLLDFAWGYDYEGTARTVDNVIVSLRKKLRDEDGENALIKSCRGLGYCLTLSR